MIEEGPHSVGTWISLLLFRPLCRRFHKSQMLWIPKAPLNQALNQSAYSSAKGLEKGQPDASGSGKAVGSKLDVEGSF